MGRVKLGAVLAMSAVLVVMGVSAASAQHPLEGKFTNRFTAGSAPPPSGAFEFADLELGLGITECPQAGLRGSSPKPLDRRQKDQVEQVSEGGNDIRTNQDYSCFPHDETTIDVITRRT